MNKDKDFHVNNRGVGKLPFELIGPNGTVVAVFRRVKQAEVSAKTANKIAAEKANMLENERTE